MRRGVFSLPTYAAISGATGPKAFSASIKLRLFLHIFSSNKNKEIMFQWLCCFQKRTKDKKRDRYKCCPYAAFIWPPRRPSRPPQMRGGSEK